MAGYKHLEIVQDFQSYVKDKKKSAQSYYRYLLSRVEKMFQYKNLPDSIPHEILDRYLFENGIACITEVDGTLYAFYGNLGGPQDAYYRPTEFIVANPHIKTANGELFSANIPVFESRYSDVGQPTGVLIRNDTEWFGLHPMLARYAYLMAENILTLRTADVMLRITSLLTAPSDKERAAALEYLKTMEKGELGVIGESPFFDGVKLQSPPSNNGSYLTQFIEYQQYLKGSFYNEIGLSANYNMKREAIGKGESTLDEDALLPLCDNMLMCRKEDLAKVNDMFGTNIEVEFSSAWLENRIEAYNFFKDSLVNQPAFGANGGAQNGEDGAFGGIGSNGADDNGSDNGDNGDNAPDGDRGNDSGFGGKEEGIRKEESENGEKEQNLEEIKSELVEENQGTPESEINDLSQDEVLNAVMEDVLNEIVGQPTTQSEEGGMENGTSGDEESSEDKTDNSDD